MACTQKGTHDSVHKRRDCREGKENFLGNRLGESEGPGAKSEWMPEAEDVQ